LSLKLCLIVSKSLCFCALSLFFPLIPRLISSGFTSGWTNSRWLRFFLTMCLGKVRMLRILCLNRLTPGTCACGCYRLLYNPSRGLRWLTLDLSLSGPLFTHIKGLYWLMISGWEAGSDYAWKYYQTSKRVSFSSFDQVLHSKEMRNSTLHSTNYGHSVRWFKVKN